MTRPDDPGERFWEVLTAMVIGVLVIGVLYLFLMVAAP